MIFLRREAEKIVRELFQPEGAAAAGARCASSPICAPTATITCSRSSCPASTPADVQVYALGDALVVEGQKRPHLPPDTRPAYDRAERDYGAFRRVFDLPGPADLSRTAGVAARGPARASACRASSIAAGVRGRSRCSSTMSRREGTADGVPAGRHHQADARDPADAGAAAHPRSGRLPVHGRAADGVARDVGRRRRRGAGDQRSPGASVRADRRVAKTSRRPRASIASAPSA